MKGFLLDENLPSRVRFNSSLPIFYATELGRAAEDSKLWQYAKTHELVIVTKDADFSDRIMASDPPPWIVHLRVGNLRRKAFHEFLERVWPRVQTLLSSNKLINVYLDHFEAISID